MITICYRFEGPPTGKMNFTSCMIRFGFNAHE